MPDNHEAASALTTFIDASPTPYHAVENVAARLSGAGFVELDEAAAWPRDAARGFVRRGGSIVAWDDGGSRPWDPFRMLGAHTDSPNLRVKPRPEVPFAGGCRVGVEVYGGVLLNSWLDRDLGIAGRLATRDGAGAREVLVDTAGPVVRIPQLAIHLDREVNDRGLVLDRQEHLRAIWTDDEQRRLLRDLAESVDVEAGDVIGHDLMLYPCEPARRLGARGEFLVGARLDNLMSVHAATDALLDAGGSFARLVAFFDHEEVGSTTASGAASAWLRRLLDRLFARRGADTDDRARALAASLFVSTDNAHATHPNYPDRHDPQHPIALNTGPVLKINANARYATDATTAGAFTLACESAGLTLQRFVNRSNLACGSTIGPITAAMLGVHTVDVGAAQLSMHSAREMTGVEDPAMLRSALSAAFGHAGHGPDGSE